MPRKSRHIAAVALAVVMSLFAAACYNAKTGDTEVYGVARFKLPVVPETGSHRVMVFSEMHYQPKFDSQDVPRLLPAPDSVPVTGREPQYESLDEYKEAAMPERIADGYSRAHAAELYSVNCQVCHGVGLAGDGPVVPYMTRGVVPANLNSDATQNSTDGELFAFIGEGGRQGYALIEAGQPSNSPMPAFKYLLSEEERWALVKYLRGQ